MQPTCETIEAGISDARLAEICRALRYMALNAKHYFGGEVPLKPLTDAADLIHALRIQNALLKAELDAIVEQKRLRKAAEARANTAEAALSIARLRSTAASSGMRDGWREAVNERGVVTLDMVASMKRDLPVLRDTPNLSLGLAMSRAILASPIPPSAPPEPSGASQGDWIANREMIADAARDNSISDAVVRSICLAQFGEVTPEIQNWADRVIARAIALLPAPPVTGDQP